jgi:ABC-type nitrate/sulfonate/bicarbonate transport system permease component
VNNKASNEEGGSYVKYLGIASVITVFTFWLVASEDGLGWFPRIKFPPPTEVFTAITVLQEKLLVDAGVTVGRVIFGMVVGTALGLGVGLLMSFSKPIMAFLNPIIESMRPVPIIAMIPFFLMWLGIAESGKLLLVTLGVFTIIVVSTIEAIRNVPRIYVNAAKTLGATKRAIHWRILLPAITPTMIGPLRVAMALTFTLVVAAEFMGAQAGIGYRILEARRLFNPQVIFLGIVELGILASLFDYFLRKIMGYITRWSGRTK